MRIATFVSFLLLIVINEVSSSDLPQKRARRARLRHELNNSTINGIFQNPSQDRRSCKESSEQIENRLTKLEVQVVEKTENLLSELRDGNYRLQAIEQRSAEVQTSLENFRILWERVAETNPQLPSPGTLELPSTNNELGKLDERIDSLVKGMQLIATTLRVLNSDMSMMGRDISTIATQTQALLLQQDSLVTKDFLSSSLINVKHPEDSAIKRTCPSSSLHEERPPRSCKEVQMRGHNISGIYSIKPEQAPRAFMVLCDMTTNGGGWTYIHNRYEGGQDFYLDWDNYKHGFGNLGGEFWLGLEHLHQLTGYDVNELLVELVDVNLEKVYAHYSAFSVGSEPEGYPLKILGGYRGDAGDSLMYHAGSKFSTIDIDQDSWLEGSCAKSHRGAWWYRSCDTSNLNGRYLKGELSQDLIYQGMYWGAFRGPQYGLLQARMLVRSREGDGFSFQGPLSDDGP